MGQIQDWYSSQNIKSDDKKPKNSD